MPRHTYIDIMSIYKVLYTFQKHSEALEIYLILFEGKIEILAGKAQSI